MPRDSPPRFQYRPSPEQPEKKDCATERGIQPLPPLDSGDKKVHVQVGSQAPRNPLALAIFSSLSVSLSLSVCVLHGSRGVFRPTNRSYDTPLPHSHT
jgi:hypothetical protein